MDYNQNIQPKLDNLQKSADALGLTPEETLHKFEEIAIQKGDLDTLGTITDIKRHWAADYNI